jgi:hypothetical protein
MIGFIVFILAVLIIFIVGYKKVKNSNSALDFLKSSGFNVSSYIFPCSPFVAFDHDKKIMAVVKTDGSISQYTANDIIDFHLEWTERNGVKSNNTVTITIRNIKQPILKIYNLSADSSRTLMGKISNL